MILTLFFCLSTGRKTHNRLLMLSRGWEPPRRSIFFWKNGRWGSGTGRLKTFPPRDKLLLPDQLNWFTRGKRIYLKTLLLSTPFIMSCIFCHRGVLEYLHIFVLDSGVLMRSPPQQWVSSGAQTAGHELSGRHGGEMKPWEGLLTETSVSRSVM